MHCEIAYVQLVSSSLYAHINTLYYFNGLYATLDYKNSGSALPPAPPLFCGTYLRSLTLKKSEAS